MVDYEVVHLLLQHGADPFDWSGSCVSGKSTLWCGVALYRRVGHVLLLQNLFPAALRLLSSVTNRSNLKHEPSSTYLCINDVDIRTAVEEASEEGKCTSVARLQHVCRVAIRRRLSQVTQQRSIKTRLSQLPLPTQVRRYVELSDVVALFDIELCSSTRSSLCQSLPRCSQLQA